jgi:hypothetical protein
VAYLRVSSGKPENRDACLGKTGVQDGKKVKETACFSKKLRNYWKAVAMAFFYINYGFV